MLKPGVIKFAIAGFLLAGSLGFTNEAQARGYHGSHYYGGHYYGGGGHYGHRHRGHRHGRHHSRRGAYLAGGLILGSLLTHAYHRSHYPRTEPYVVRERRVIRSTPHVVERRTTKRLFRDRDGNCFERTFNRNGDELLVELDPAECAW